MRAAIENWLVGKWYGGRRSPWYLRLLEPVYHSLFRRAQNRAKTPGASYRPRLPLVVVGNITAGGSGKTPLVIRLCQIALDMNLKPGIASTGYGRQGKDTVLVTANSDARTCGDEPVMLAARTGVPVVVAANRIDAVKKLGEMGLDLVFSDDGLQQAGLERDIEFCVIDGARGLGNAHLIPAGPLREPPGRLRSVNFVVSNGEWGSQPADVSVSVMELEATVIRSLDDSKQYSVEQFRQLNTGNTIHAIAGIGNPDRFFNLLEKKGLPVDRNAFPDHHPYVPEDFQSYTGEAVIIMTEKDAVKCRSLGINNAWYLPVETRLPEKLEIKFKERLRQLVKDTD